MKSGINKGVTMKNIKFLLTIIFIFCLSGYLLADIYPAPENFSASKGAAEDVTISWEHPTPPDFGEGFESASIPPEDWEIEVTNDNYTWQIMDNINYVHSGSYSACVPWTYDEESQDEWLMSPAYEVSDGDELIFYLGTSKTFGINSPVYVLISVDDFATYDTLIVCNGQDISGNQWEFQEYAESLDGYNTNARIAFRYLGGNGDLVCLDDVSIAGRKVDIANFFVIPTQNTKNLNISRAPLNKKSRSITLTGYKLFKKVYVDNKFKQIPDKETILTDTVYIDEEVLADTAYSYKSLAIFNDVIPSTNYSESDIGYIADTIEPPKPSDIRANTNWTEANGITFRWTNPFATDITSYNIYNGEYLIANVEFQPDVDSYSILFTADPSGENEYQLNTEIYNLGVTSVDFNGNESEINPGDIQTVAPAPQTGISTGMFYNEITITKWAPGEECSIDDNIKLYRSTDDDLDTFTLLKEFSDASSAQYFDAGVLEYSDYEASTDSAYFYYATLEYPEHGTSDISYIWPESTPEYTVDNISNLEYEVFNDYIEFSWDEPSGDSLRYAGVYLYRGSGSGTPADTVYRGTTTYNYNIETPGISNFTFWPFDIWGTKADSDKKTIIENLFFKLDYVYICQDTSKVIENFENGIDPLWSQFNKGDAEATWNASDSGSSQWFPVTADDGFYGWINDDLLGNQAYTNCYLALPEITGLTSDDKVYMMFDNFYSDEYDGSATVALNVNGNWTDIYNVIDKDGFLPNEWQTYSLTISSFLEADQMDSFQIGFHYNDNETWSAGWAIDNVSVLSTSQPDVPAKLQLNQENQFFQANTYPNPFRDNINFSFYLKESSDVSLEIFNILGQKIATVSNATHGAGMNKLNWDGMDSNDKKVSAGIYFYRLKIEDNVKTSKFMMIE